MFNLFINPFVHCKNPLWIIYTAKIEAQMSPCNVNFLIVVGECPIIGREISYCFPKKALLRYACFCKRSFRPAKLPFSKNFAGLKALYIQTYSIVGDPLGHPLSCFYSYIQLSLFATLEV